ncbi:alkaline phosphatase PafA [Aureibacter tunicatorum]|uniref:AlkP superfamily pyrophosphatase or phosphodiesterase n=1 Tax=Aureibacter tunicatorum TaxID=866807 RepID=A0AAE3XP41_9BACT|nr:alkaline phosphatase PafA [Aureibacter tunicatorum]MDR6238669.1 putative AlkP superfamily pyrophosphatase or phosphodiesterase [Aureibacter tunicatorum]BDD05400.1 alkaline phosphatase family protein [Aureibacter tunicatorum]
MKEFSKNLSRVFFTIWIVAASFCQAVSQDRDDETKLIVGVVVDQMRQEYLTRFYDKFGDEGFKKLLEEGFEMQNAHYNYVPTATGPGHASIYTGTTPAFHGIVSNNWYDRDLKKSIYCVYDSTERTVGSKTKAGMASPQNLLSTTITDELKLFSQFESKVISVAIKDRSAILPAGHKPDGAFWFDAESGNFVTSTYYMDELPGWLRVFNNRKLPKTYLNQQWTTVFPIDQYTESTRNDDKYVISLSENGRFPYDLKKISIEREDKGYEVIPFTPFGNDLTLEVAKAAIDGEGLGKNDKLDFLAVSFSSTDIIGHSYGPEAVEIEDTYIRLDKNIAELISYLDEKVGKDKYVMFLTADHAGADNPQFLMDRNFPAGFFHKDKAFDQINGFLTSKYGEAEWVEDIDYFQVYLNQDLIAKRELSLRLVRQQVADFLLENDEILLSYSGYLLGESDYNSGGGLGFMVRGYMAQESGDVLFGLKSGWLDWFSKKGTTHGTFYTYDTHVPIIFYGNVPKGKSVRRCEITDIATTLSLMMGIKFPSAATGESIVELFDD